MAKTFSSIKKSLGLLDVIQFGKYKGCRVDSIVDMDDKYITYLQAQGVKFDKEVTLAVSNKVQIFDTAVRSEEHTSELQSLRHLVCRLLLEKKKKHISYRLR